MEPFFGPANPLFPVSNVLVEPGVWGGAEWSPLSHNPNLGLTYIPVNIKPVLVTTVPEAQPNSAHNFLGIAGWWSFGFQEDNDAEQSGALVAMDPLTGTIKWRVETDTPHFGGTCATEGGLVFMGENVNNPGDPGQPFAYFTAFDARNGNRLFQWRVPGDVGVNAPCVTYKIDGRQYIAIAIGGQLRANGLFRGNNGDSIYVLGLPDDE